MTSIDLHVYGHLSNQTLRSSKMIIVQISAVTISNFFTRHSHVDETAIH